MKKKGENQNGMSFKLKLTILLVSVIILPVLTTGAIAYISSKNILENDLENNAVAIGNTISGTLDTFITNNEQNIEMLSNNFNVTDILYKPLEEHIYLYNLLEEFQQSHPNILTIYVGTSDKQMFMYPETTLPAGFDPTVRPWYQDAVNKNKLIWTAPYVDDGTGQLVVTVAKPVYSTKGDLTGVVGADISLDTLSEFISMTKVGSEGYFYLADTKGIVLAHKDATLINNPVPAKEILDGIMAGTKESIHYEFNNDKRFCNIIHNQKVGWNIISSISYTEVSSESTSILRTIGISAIFIIFLGIVAALLVSNPISRALRNVVDNLKKISQGDLTARSNVSSRDEFGVLASSLNLMSEELGRLMKNIKGMAQEISTASDTLASTSEETSASNEEVAKAVDEVAGAANDQAKGTEEGLLKMNELSESIEGVSGAIDNMRKRLEEVMGLNSNGTNTVKLLIQRAEDNNNASKNVSSVISEMDNQTKQIGFIIDTIGQIAEQTNLLALNASIEAARAGEAGRGFSVVAEEIRKLAEQSSGAANQIRSLITGIQDKSKNAVDSMAAAKEAIDGQTKAVEDTERIFGDITKSIMDVNGEIDSIVELNKVMVNKKDEISAVVESISATAEETAASTEEISASAQQQIAAIEEVANTAGDLSELALKLNNAVDKFII